MFQLTEGQFAALEDAYAAKRRACLRERYARMLAAWIGCTTAEAAAWFDHVWDGTAHLAPLEDAELLMLAELARLEEVSIAESRAYRTCCDRPVWPMRPLWLRSQLDLAAPDHPLLAPETPS